MFEVKLTNLLLFFQITDACNACFEQRQIFTQQVIAKVLNQLVCTNLKCQSLYAQDFSIIIFDSLDSGLQVEQIPLPLLFMRTVLQAIGAFPALVSDVYFYWK